MSTILVCYAAVTVMLVAVLLLVIVLQSVSAHVRRPRPAVTTLPVRYATGLEQPLAAPLRRAV